MMLPAMKPVELVPVALRVLSACTKRNALDPHDIEILQQHASPHEADLDMDVLACAIIRREAARELDASRTDRKGVKSHVSARRKKSA
jgi:hypothetical protein